MIRGLYMGTSDVVAMYQVQSPTASAAKSAAIRFAGHSFQWTKQLPLFESICCQPSTPWVQNHGPFSGS